MKAELEYKSDAAYFEPRTGMVYQDDGLPIPDGSFVSVCCYRPDQKQLSLALTNAGYVVSHGCCEIHAKELLKQP